MGTIQKAGAIILNTTEPKSVALLYRDKQKDWTFPKGHIDSGEGVFETVKREIFEETGLKIELIKRLPDLVYPNSANENVQVTMYLVRSLGNKIKTELDGDAVEWVVVANVEDKLSYENLKKYFSEIKNIVAN